jgi:hypothetical protein
VGIAGLGSLSLGAGFLNTKIVLIIFRALSGIRAYLDDVASLYAMLNAPVLRQSVL